MGVSGVDVQLSEKASELFPYAVECKNQEKLRIWKELKQASDENRDLTPILIFKRNHSKTYVAMEINDFFDILEELKWKEQKSKNMNLTGYY